MMKSSIDSPGVRTGSGVFLKKHILDVLFWAGLAIFIAIRFAHAGLIEFKSDEYIALKYAYLNIHHKLALVGLMSSTGLYNPPFFVYLMSIPVLFTTNPVLVTSFVMVLNSIGIVLLYFFLKKWFGKGVARIATLLAASAPWAILYSRKIWAQDCLFPLMIVFYIIFFSNLEKYSRIKTYVIFFLLAIITQLHMSAWFLFLPIGAFYLITKEKIRLPDLVIGFCIAGLTYVPYALYHYSSHFANFDYFIENRMQTFVPPGNIVWSFIITCGFKFSYFLGDSGFDKFLTGYSIGIPYLFFLLYLVLTLAGFGYGCLVVANLIKHLVVKKETVDPSHKIILLFLLIFIMTHACYLLFKINPLPHYSIIFYPILPVFTACFIEYGLKKIRIIKKAATCLVVLVLISNLYFITVFYNFIGHEPQSINGDYGIPYLFVKSDVQKYLDPKVLGSLH